MKGHVRLQILLFVAACIAAGLAYASPAGAATRACPVPGLTTTPCVITAQNNVGSALSATPTRLVSTTVAPGRYSVVASAVVFNSSGPGEPTPFAHCTLKAGRALLDEFTAYTLDQATTVTLLGAGNFTAATRLSVACAEPSGFASLTGNFARLQATQLGSLKLPVNGASARCPKPSSTASPCAIHLETTSPAFVGQGLTPVASLTLAAGSYTMIGRVAFGPTPSSASVQCDTDDGVIGLSNGRTFVYAGKTAELTFGTTFTLSGASTVEVTCNLLDATQATVDNVRLTLVRVAKIVPAPSAVPAKCPLRSTTVPCAITAFGGAASLTSTHSVYAETNVGPGHYAVSGAVSIENDDPAQAFHYVDCALVSGPGQFGAAFEVVGGQGATLFTLDAHTKGKADITLSCADDSASGFLTVTSAQITATRVGTLLSSGS